MSLTPKIGANVFTSTKTNLTASYHSDSAIASAVVRSRLRNISIRISGATAAALFLLAARSASAQTHLTYLQVPSAGNMPGAGNDGPAIYNLPGYGNVEVSMTNVTPNALGATYFDQINAYNETTNNATENANYGMFTWGTDTQRFDELNNTSPGVNEQYDFNFTFLSGAPNIADLYFVVDGLAYGTTATVSQAGNLVGEYTFPYSNPFYVAGPSSTTLYGVAGPQTFSSAGDKDPLNTGWALWQPTSAITSGTGSGGATVSFDVDQIPGDGIGFTVGYTTVPEPCSLGLLGVGTLGLLSRRRRASVKSCPV